MRRRTVLFAAGAAGVAAVAGCTRSDRARPGGNRSPGPFDPLLNLASAEELLLGRYTAVLARHPALVGRLGPLRADHAAHLSALCRAAGAGPTSPAAASTPGQPVAADVAAAVAGLAAAERTAAAAFGAACLTAPAARAMLLGSIAACETSHLVVLG